MLKNQDTVPEPQITSGAPRVTPEELTQALAAIEARKQAEASRLAGTIPIDQAISDLHLDSTSDEIWDEVQAQRAKASAAVPRVQPRVQAIPPQTVTVQPQKSKPRLGWMGIFTPILIGWVLIQTGIIPQFWGHVSHSVPPIFHSAAPPILRPVSSFADGTDFYADDAALVQISEGKPFSQITASKNETGNRWTMLKSNGHIYLHGYIVNTKSLLLLQGKALHIYNDDNSGELNGDSTSKITIQVDGVPLQRADGDGDGYSEVSVPNFQPGPMTTLDDWY